MLRDYKNTAYNPYVLPKSPRFAWKSMVLLTIINVILTGTALYLLHTVKLLN